MAYSNSGQIDLAIQDLEEYLKLEPKGERSQHAAVLLKELKAKAKPGKGLTRFWKRG